MAGAAMLNSALYHSGRFRAIQKEMTKPSSATMTVPAAGPKSKTEAKTNVSETEMDAGTEGSFTVAEPLTRVRAASMYHWNPSGSAWILYRDCATAVSPAVITSARYNRPLSVILPNVGSAALAI